MMYRHWHLLMAREERVEEQGSVFSSCSPGWNFSSQFLTAISRDITLNSHSWCKPYCFRLTSNQVTLFTSSNSLSGNFRGTLPSNSKLHLFKFGPACGKTLWRSTVVTVQTQLLFFQMKQYFICFSAGLSQNNLAHDLLCISFARFHFCVIMTTMCLK